MLPNELLLLLSLIVSFGGVLVFFRLFGKSGIYAWTSVITIAANIEVLILVRAFGMDQTLGNCLFAASFVSTDILSECYGRKAANRAVWLGIATNLAFVCISQLWLLYTPAQEDWAMEAIRKLFTMTPRLMGASLLGYAASEFYDVWAYHKLWDLTKARTGSSERMLWLRNNLATLSAQLINVVVFTLVAFWELYDGRLLLRLCASAYAIYVVTSLLDTQVVYFARWMFRHRMTKDGVVLADQTDDGAAEKAPGAEAARP